MVVTVVGGRQWGGGNEAEECMAEHMYVCRIL